jgi:hypothetical protein
MPKTFQQLTLRERLAQFPPWLILALCHVRNPRQTKEECNRRLWNKKTRRERRQLKQEGHVLPRRPMSRRPTFQEIAAKVPGLKWYTVRWIVQHLTWDNLTVAQMLAFTEACGFSLTKSTNAKIMKQNLANQFKQGQPFQHLTETQRRELGRKMERWRKLNQGKEVAT